MLLWFQNVNEEYGVDENVIGDFIFYSEILQNLPENMQFITISMLNLKK